MTNVKVQDLASCDASDCDAVRLRSTMRVCSEVLLEPRSGRGKDGKTVYEGINHYRDYCVGCAPIWTSHTNTSGYDRYYLRHNAPLGRAPTGPVEEIHENGVKV